LKSCRVARIIGRFPVVFATSLEKAPNAPCGRFFSVKARNIKLVILNDRFAKVEETRVGTGIAVRS